MKTIHRGGIIAGFLMADNLQPKQIAIRAGVHPSRFSRIINGKEEIDDLRYARIFVEIGQARAEQRSEQRREKVA